MIDPKKLALICLCLIFFSTVVTALDKIANDPSRIGVGARILGMGKSYVGLADDVSGIFIDPAALASVKDWQITSMSGNFINEYLFQRIGKISYGSWKYSPFRANR